MIYGTRTWHYLIIMMELVMMLKMIIMVITKTWRRRIIVCNGNSDFH